MLLIFVPDVPIVTVANHHNCPFSPPFFAELSHSHFQRYLLRNPPLQTTSRWLTTKPPIITPYLETSRHTGIILVQHCASALWKAASLCCSMVHDLTAQQAGSSDHPLHWMTSSEWLASTETNIDLNLPLSSGSVYTESEPFEEDIPIDQVRLLFRYSRSGPALTNSSSGL